MRNYNKNTRKTVETFRLRDLIKPAFDLWLFSWLLGLIMVLSIIGLLMMSGWFLTSAALAGMVAIGTHTFNYMLPAAIIRMFAIFRTAARYGELMVSHNAIFELLKELRLKFFRTLAKQPLTSQHQALQSSQQMHRLVSDIGILDSFNLRVVSPWLLSSLVVFGVTGFIILILPKLTISWVMTICLLMMMTLIIPAIISYRGIGHSRQVAKVTEQRRDGLLAPLSIITQLLLWRQWQKQTADFITHDDHLQQLDWQAQKGRSIAMLVIQWLFYAVMIVVMVAIAQLSHNNDLIINVPILLAVVLGLFGIQEIVVPLGQHYLSLGNSLASKQRLNELLDITTATSEPVSKPLPTKLLSATLANVNAKMPNALVGANNVNTTIRAGIPLIVTGTSGCGKSTLLQTLSNELKAQSGSITLNDDNKVEWQDYDWADQLGYLGQQLDIFDQTLANNLRLGNPSATTEELMNVLKAVGLDGWIESQPQGLQTRLGEYGTAVSGGQARRIALARLLLKPRKVLLLDEPFAGLDSDTRSRVWHTIRKHQSDGLLVVVSHHHEWDDMGEVDRLNLEMGL